jgi:hypothetical protein
MIPDFANPYVQGNWAGIKMMKKSTGDNKHTPGAKCSPITNTPKLEDRTTDYSGGMATPSDGPTTN